MKKELNIPYGTSSLTCKIEENLLKAVISDRMHQYVSAGSPDTIVSSALANPLGTKPLHELVKGKKRITIVTSDHTRPMPSSVTMPLLLSEIRRGNPDADITILIGTGTHRATTPQEIENRFGPAITASERICVHDCDELDSMREIGRTPAGNMIALNKLAVETDLLIAEGFIEPHFFAGFSGGRKSIMPGVAARSSIMYNHCAEMIADCHSQAGILEHNPIHEDMVFAAKKTGLAFILNVVLNNQKEIVAAFAGDMEKAHQAGTGFLASLCQCAPVISDIVITSNGGYPLDQNIYQSVKCMTTAAKTCRPGGVIIAVCQCRDGHGGDSFFETFASEPDTRLIMEQIQNRNSTDTVPDQWQSQIFCRILLNYHVILVSDAPKSIVEHLHLTYATGIDEAIVLAKAMIQTERPSITVIPDGLSVMF